MTRELVDRPELAIENILRYQTELRDDARLAGLMKSAHTWFAARSDDGAWLFAPSKFVGYAGNTAEIPPTITWPAAAKEAGVTWSASSGAGSRSYRPRPP